MSNIIRGMTRLKKPIDLDADFPIPNKIHLSGRMHYEENYADISSNRFSIKSHGRPFLFDFNKIEDAWWRHLIKYYICSRLRRNAVNSCYGEYNRIFSLFSINYFEEKSTEMAFAYLKELSTSEFYNAKGFIVFLCLHNISPFNNESYLIAKDLSASEKHNPYEKIFLHQHSLSVDARKRLLAHLNDIGGGITALSSRMRTDILILRICYELGLRPSQIAALNIDDFIIHKSDKIGAAYYSLRATYVKQRHEVPVRRLKCISDKLGADLDFHVKQCMANGAAGGHPLLYKLKRRTRLSSYAISKAINDQFALLGIDVGDHQGGATALRHNMAQQLADKGASSDEIAEAMTHNSIVAARAYIAATPDIGQIKTRALGRSSAYLKVMDLLLQVRLKNTSEWDGRIPIAQVGIRTIVGVGGCAASSCQLDPIYGCYGGAGLGGSCESFNPFRDGDHQAVIDALEEQVHAFIDVSEQHGEIKSNPALLQLERTLENVRGIKALCEEENQGRGHHEIS